MCRHSLREKVAKHPLFLNALKVCYPCMVLGTYTVPQTLPCLHQGHQDALTGFAFSPNGSLLATACEDRELRVFQIADDVTSPKMSFWRTTLKQDPVDVAFGAQPDLFVLSKVRQPELWLRFWKLVDCELTKAGPFSAGRFGFCCASKVQCRP